MPVSQCQNVLSKDVSISSALLALIAQQEEENVAAEKQNLVRLLQHASLGTYLKCRSRHTSRELCASQLGSHGPHTAGGAG